MFSTHECAAAVLVFLLALLLFVPMLAGDITGEDGPEFVTAAAVLRRGEVTGVYVADGKGGFSLRQLRVGSTLDDASVEVLAGLSGGETIALDPVRAGLVRRKP